MNWRDIGLQSLELYSTLHIGRWSPALLSHPSPLYDKLGVWMRLHSVHLILWFIVFQFGTVLLRRCHNQGEGLFTFVHRWGFSILHSYNCRLQNFLCQLFHNLESTFLKISLILRANQREHSQNLCSLWLARKINEVLRIVHSSLL